MARYADAPAFSMPQRVAVPSSSCSAPSASYACSFGGCGRCFRDKAGLEAHLQTTGHRTNRRPGAGGGGCGGKQGRPQQVVGGGGGGGRGKKKPAAAHPVAHLVVERGKRKGKVKGKAVGKERIVRTTCGLRLRVVLPVTLASSSAGEMTKSQRRRQAKNRRKATAKAKAAAALRAKVRAAAPRRAAAQAGGARQAAEDAEDAEWKLRLQMATQALAVARLRARDTFRGARVSVKASRDSVYGLVCAGATTCRAATKAAKHKAVRRHRLMMRRRGPAFVAAEDEDDFWDLL